MEKRPLLLLTACLLLISTASSSQTSTPPDHPLSTNTSLPLGRDLLQKDEIVVTEEGDSLSEIVEEASKGSTISLKTPLVILTEHLTITAEGLSIKGLSKESPAIIQCTSASARIDVETDNVSFQNVVIRDCQGPSVRIRNPNTVPYDPFAPPDTESEEVENISISFKNVRFVNNSDPDASFSYDEVLDGGAIQVTASTEALVEDCIFERNSAFLGGAIRVDSGSITVRGSTFIENESQISGGAISGSYSTLGQASTTSFVIEDSIFLRNKDILGGEDSSGLTLPNGAPLETSEFLSFPTPQSSGGAIYVQGFATASISGCLFDGNTANPAAGAIFVSDNDQVELYNNTLRNNVAEFSEGTKRYFDLEQGGAVYVAFTKAESTIKISRCIFENNTATYGGGLHMVMMLVTRASISECSFERNSAHLGGGGMVLRNTIEVEILDTKFLNNRATAGGGALFTNGAGARFSQGADYSRDTVFEENIALDGGACFFLGAGQVATQKLGFFKNKAQRNGGGMCIVESLASGSVSLQQSLFYENTARRGGGIFVDSIASLILRAPYEDTATEFYRNKAMAGGAIYLRPSSQVKNVMSASRLNCTENTAVKTLTEVYTQPLPYADIDIIETETTRTGRNLKQSLFQDKDDGSEVLLRTTGEDPCSPGGGGAICLVLSEVPERASVKVEILNSHISGNRASTGGGMFISTKQKSTWNSECNLGGTTSESLTDNPCRQLSIRDVSMELNSASDAGGAVFASDANQVHFSTEKDAIKDAKYKKLSEFKTRLTEAQNTVEYGGYGGQYASNAVRMEILTPKGITSNGRQLIVANHASGTPLPEIKLRIVDAFGNTVTSGIADSELKVSVSSTQGVVSGQLVATAEAGVAVFDSLIVTAHPNTYTLSFNAEGDEVEELRASLSIRSCRMGEHNITEGKICSVCQPGFYGFDPKVPCQACKAEANCTGGSTLIPKNGYWHSTPFSTQFHQCLVTKACSYLERQETLSTFHDEGNIPGKKIYSNDEYPQCNEGYKDVLCGSCDVNYGNKPGGECVECKGTAATYAIISFVALWQLILLGFTIRSALNSIRDMRDMRAIVAQNNGGNATDLPKTYQIKLSSTPTSSGLGTSSSKKFSLEVNTERESSLSSDASEKRVASIVSKVSDRSISLGGASMRNLTPIDHIIAAETVSETIKIAVNFLQVTSVAVSINVEWTETVKRMLETEHSASGFSNGTAFAPLTCLLDNSMYRSIHGMLLRVAFPVSLLIFVIFLFFLNWLRVRKCQNKGFEYIHSRSVICVLVALFFSYESLNREFMRTVNCVHLDEVDPTDETGYDDYAQARGTYWGEDTSFKCFEGTHLRLVTFLGVPGLTLFSFGIPAFLLGFLLYNRERKKINEQQFLNTYGFVYQNYTERFVYWEVSIMLRKACIGGIVVFAYPLGANLQGIMALGVLIIALVLHLVATPFKYSILNVLESFSLIVSIFTFYSGIVFNDVNTSYPAKVLLSALLIVINSSLFVMFMVRVLMDVDKFITAKLIIFGEVELPNGFIGRCIRLTTVLLSMAKEQVHQTFQIQASRLSRAMTRVDRSGSNGTVLSGIQEGDVELAHHTT